MRPRVACADPEEEAALGRLVVGHRHDVVTLEVHRGHRGEAALAFARVVPQAASLEEPAHGPDRQLVAHADRLVPACEVLGRLDRAEHPLGLLGVGLSPRRPERVDQVGPVPRMPQGAVTHPELQALEVVLRLDQPAVGRPPGMRSRDGRCGLLRSLERRGDDVGDVAVGEGLGHDVGHLSPELGQVVARQPPVEDALGVVDLAVAHEVDQRGLGHAVPSAARRAAPGSASATRSRARSSCAAETNHASKALGGSETPASSIPWKKAAYVARAGLAPWRSRAPRGSRWGRRRRC